MEDRSRSRSTDCSGCDQSLLDSYESNATPTSPSDMVMTSETSETTLDRYIRSMSSSRQFSPPQDPLTSSVNGSPGSNGSGGMTPEVTTITTVHSPKRQSRKYNQVPEELQHVSEMSISEDSYPKKTEDHSSTVSRASSLLVEIQDLGGDSVNLTTSTLRKCKQLVLNPYWALLVFIGWRAFRKDTIYAHQRRWLLLNIAYTTTIILLLFYTYSYEILACEWKLDMSKDTHEAPPTTSMRPSTKANVSKNGSEQLASIEATQPVGNETSLGSSRNIGCDHIVTSYLVPNVLHLCAYIMGLYYFRIQESEQLYALMEKVFLQSSPLQVRNASQHKMIVKLRLFLAVGSFWVLMTVVLQCLYVWAFDFPRLALFRSTGTVGYWIMFSVELVGRTVFHSVILAIVINFSTQCEMVKFYVRGLAMRLQEKSTDLQTAMKDILLLRQSLGMLNGVISKMTSLVAFILAELTIIGICIIFANEIDEPLVWVYRLAFPFVWACMLAFPFFQGARVNSICLRIQKIAVEMRVFGYKDASILDLDSFLQFATLTKLKAKLLHMPLLPSHLIFTIIIAALVFLILLQTNSLGHTNSFLNKGL